MLQQLQRAPRSAVPDRRAVEKPHEDRASVPLSHAGCSMQHVTRKSSRLDFGVWHTDFRLCTARCVSSARWTLGAPLHVTRRAPASCRPPSGRSVWHVSRRSFGAVLMQMWCGPSADAEGGRTARACSRHLCGQAQRGGPRELSPCSRRRGILQQDTGCCRRPARDRSTQAKGGRPVVCHQLGPWLGAQPRSGSQGQGPGRPREPLPTGGGRYSSSNHVRIAAVTKLPMNVSFDLTSAGSYGNAKSLVAR